MLRVLDIDADSERILHAAVCREMNIVDAADYFEGLSVEDLQIEDENSEESDGWTEMLLWKVTRPRSKCISETFVQHWRANIVETQVDALSVSCCTMLYFNFSATTVQIYIAHLESNVRNC